MLDFLRDQHGLDVLLSGLEKLSRKKSLKFIDTFILLECVACIKAIMNSQAGLDYIIEDEDFTQKLAAGKLII